MQLSATDNVSPRAFSTSMARMTAAAVIVLLELAMVMRRSAVIGTLPRMANPPAPDFFSVWPL